MIRILAILLLVAASSAEAGPSRQSVNDWGADPTGKRDSSWAFQKATNQAGWYGQVDCDPGFYRIDETWWIAHPQMTVNCPGATLIAGPTVDIVLEVVEKNPRGRVSMLDIALRGINGKSRDVTCLRISDSNFSSFRIGQIIGCDIGVHVLPTAGVTADNKFIGRVWEFNNTAIKVECGDHHVQSNRFDVNFVANNGVGLDVAEGVCASMFWFEGSLDQFKRGVDGWVRAPNSLVRTSYVTPKGSLEVSDTTYYVALYPLGAVPVVQIGDRNLHEGEQ